ncbi:MAG: tyrosine-type recombinase/integrase, partial [Cyanobacteria bacterium P01_A01_bin.17]
KKGYVPKPRSITGPLYAAYLNRLAEQHQICDEDGKLWYFRPHQFRHTVGTRMINNGVPQHIVQRYLGHESPDMTAVYAHIHDQTLKAEIFKFHANVVNIAGQVVESIDVQADNTDLQWFKRHIQAQALPNGSCALPTVSKACPHANACLTCTHFRTTPEYLDHHRQQLDATRQLIQTAQANGWQRQLEMNQRIQTNLEAIIAGLEAQQQ